MELQDNHKEILEYLYKHGPANTFKLSRELEMDRDELISMVKELTNRGLTAFKSGVATWIKKEAPRTQIIKSKEIGGKAIDPESGKLKGKIQKSENDWLKKEKELKNEVRDLKTQRDSIAQTLAEERKLFSQIKEEIKAARKDSAEIEDSRQREAAVKEREEALSAAQKKFEEDKVLLAKEQENVAKKISGAIELEKEKLAKAKKRLKRGKERISKLEPEEVEDSRNISYQDTLKQYKADFGKYLSMPEDKRKKFEKRIQESREILMKKALFS